MLCADPRNNAVLGIDHFAKFFDVSHSARSHFRDKDIAIEPDLIDGAGNSDRRIKRSACRDHLIFFRKDRFRHVLDARLAEATRNSDLYAGTFRKYFRRPLLEPFVARHVVNLYDIIRKRKERGEEEGHCRDDDVSEIIRKPRDLPCAVGEPDAHAENDRDEQKPIYAAYAHKSPCSFDGYF